MLYNIISNKKLKKSLIYENKKRITVSFYKYFFIKNPKFFRDNLYKKFIKLKIFGRVYISNEGINAQISIIKNLYFKLQNVIKSFNHKLNNLHMNIANDDNGKSFWVLRMKVRSKIVSDGIRNKNFNIYNYPKQYLQAYQINKIIDNDNTIFIDIRNNYEYEIGHFKNAIKIPANTFREQIEKIPKFLENYKNKKIILYCTGGIRCEKASAWIQFHDFKNVYQIKGGIIEYIKCCKKENLPIYFKGKMFVFDNRMQECISNDVLSFCHQCGKKCDKHINCKNSSCHFLFIQCNKCFKKNIGCCSFFCIKKILNNKKS